MGGVIGLGKKLLTSPSYRAGLKALLKSPINSLREIVEKGERPSGTTNYLFCMAHPDDEILIAGFGNRASRQGRASFMTFTDGGANTDRDRLPELQESYAVMGYYGKVDNLMNEMEIYGLAKSEPGTSADKRNVSRLAELVLWGSEEIARRAEEAKAGVIVTNAFEGGHPVHDLTNMATFLAARSLLGVRLYETPQYSLVLNDGIKVSEVEAAINHNKNSENGNLIPVSNLARYSMGIPLTEASVGLHDPSLGVKDGSFDVTFGDFRRKLAMKGIHASQGKSLGGSSRNITHADFSRERILAVPTERDFTTLPSRAYPLYELCKWRINPISFETIRRVAMELELDGREE